MFPLRDSTPPERTPLVNWILIALNVAVFAYIACALPDAELRQEFVEHYGIVPSRLAFGLAHPALLRDATTPWLREVALPLVTYAFVHGGLLHLLANLWFLLVFGDNVEGRLGHLRYLAFYVFCGVAAAVVHALMVPAMGVEPGWRDWFVHGRDPALDVPLIGASGAIAGVLGAYLLSFPRARVLTFIPPFFVVELPAALFLVLWFVLQLFAARSETLSQVTRGGVAYWAHVGGFAAGLLAALLVPARRPRSPQFAP